MTSLRQYLKRFLAGKGRWSIEDFTSDHIEQFLEKFPEPGSRKTALNRISALFSYACQKKFIEANPCREVHKIKVEIKPPAILSVDQSRALLAWCPTAFKPWLVLGMYAGIRPDRELLKMNWEHINLETATVRVLFPKVKKHKRIVPLEPIAVELLKRHPIQSGPVTPSKSTMKRFKRRAREVIGEKVWPKDILRHSAASYLIAKHEDVAKVAKWLGNSVSIIMDHYHDPVTKDACDRFWTLPSHSADGDAAQIRIDYKNVPGFHPAK